MIHFRRPWAWVLIGTLFASTAAFSQDQTERDLIRMKKLIEETPRLRINVMGHTANVQALAFTPDSERLCSAGLDKVVQVWNLSAIGRDIKRTFLKERTIRWQVARGLRGSIYSIATAPSDGLLAIGGYGAMGSLGEIVLVDPLQGEMLTALLSHEQSVISMAFSADGNWLASSDSEGKTVLWTRGVWKPDVLTLPDSKQYGDVKAREILAFPKVRPIAIIGNREVVVPMYEGKDPTGQPKWSLRLFSIADRARKPRNFGSVHTRLVTAIAVSPDGRQMATSDITGKLLLWDLTRAAAPQSLATKGTVRSLSFSPTQNILVAGVARDTATEASELQVWNLATQVIQSSRPVPHFINACAVSPDGQQIAYTGGRNNQVYLETIATKKLTELKAHGRPILKVAFAAKEPGFRVAFGTKPRAGTFNNYAVLEETFDLTELEPGPKAPIVPGDWMNPALWQGGWKAERQRDLSLLLSLNGAAVGKIPLTPYVDGDPQCYCWIPDAQGKPFAIAIGTNLTHDIFVYRLAAKGPLRLLRQFRGHSDYVTSLGVSRDARYLVSSSADETIQIWSLSDLARGETLEGRWGTGLAIANGQVKAANINPAGPLFRRGMREGDTITEVLWLPPGREFPKGLVKINTPDEIVRQLRELPRDKQLLITYNRNGAAQLPMQIVSSWQAISTLFIAGDQEWAYWTPEGYYDASPNGYTMFGWQVNRGLQVLPDYYRADQFQKTLERGDVLEHLLSSGNLPAAFKKAEQAPPPKLQQVVEDHIAVTPLVKIESPRTGQLVKLDETKVRAKIRLPGEGKMVSTKVFANGVVTAKANLISQVDIEGGKEFVYEWDVSLPSDARNLIQVMIGTDAPTAAFSNVLVNRDEKAAPPEPPKLYVLSVGVNEYQDKNIQALSYSVADAEAVAAMLREKATGLYALDQPKLLLNEDVTRGNWKTSFADMSKALQEKVRPNDLLVIFLAGHGFVDEKSQKYYYASYDLSVDDFVGGSYASCISWNDFELLADIPCRKLAFLDTCHSGAIQPLRQRHLKAAIRDFQEDVIFTVTASSGSERSAENRAWGHGAFTKCLLEALEGRADNSRDGVITLTEVIDYVKQAVPELTKDGQHPTAAPDELLPFITLGLTKTSRLTTGDVRVGSPSSPVAR